MTILEEQQREYNMRILSSNTGLLERKFKRNILIRRRRRGNQGRMKAWYERKDEGIRREGEEKERDLSLKRSFYFQNIIMTLCFVWLVLLT